jgi:hypothetical protein
MVAVSDFSGWRSRDRSKTELKALMPEDAKEVSGHMRWIVSGKAAHGLVASPSQMGRFETQWLAAPTNLAALTDIPVQWIELMHDRRQRGALPPFLMPGLGQSSAPPSGLVRTRQMRKNPSLFGSSGES